MDPDLDLDLDVDVDVDADTDPNADPVEPAADSTAAPVLVVHGAAVRNRQGFEAEVDRLARAVGGQRRFVPVFWGDLARPAESIESVLPYLEWLNRSREVTASVDDPAAELEPPAEARRSRYRTAKSRCRTGKRTRRCGAGGDSSPSGSSNG